MLEQLFWRAWQEPNEGPTWSVYVATGGAKAGYAALTWHPWIEETSLEEPETAQRICRRIAGLKTTPKDAICNFDEVWTTANKDKKQTTCSYPMWEIALFKL